MTPTHALAGRLLGAAEELAGTGLWSMELDPLASAWSDGMYRIYGLEPGDAAPGPAMLLEHTPEADRERLATLLDIVVRLPDRIPASGVALEYRGVRPDGSVRELVARGRIERDTNERPVRWVGIAQDVTDQRVLERQLVAHHALGQALRGWSSLREGGAGLLRRLGMAMDFALGCLWLPDATGESLACRAIWQAPGVDAGRFESLTRGHAFRRGEGIPGAVWATGSVAIKADIGAIHDRARREAARAAGLRSGIAFPAVREQDGPIAVLSFYSRDRRPPTDCLARTLGSIGGELGRFLERRTAELAPGPLSARELEVLQLAADGYTGPRIAEALVVSQATVKTHFENIYAKLGVGDRASAVAHALRAGLIR